MPGEGGGSSFLLDWLASKVSYEICYIKYLLNLLGSEMVVVFNTLVFIDSFIPTERNLFGGNSFLLDWLASKVTYI
jgi:hypothetical protein